MSVTTTATQAPCENLARNSVIRIENATTRAIDPIRSLTSQPPIFVSRDG